MFQALLWLNISWPAPAAVPAESQQVLASHSVEEPAKGFEVKYPQVRFGREPVWRAGSQQVFFFFLLLLLLLF